MADVALVFGWPLSEMRDMEIDELLEWHRMATERAKALAKTRLV